jgi:hypothetical protein
MMTRVVSNRSSPSAGLVNPVDRPPVFRVIAEAWRELREGLLNTYRPELLTCAGQGPNGAKNMARRKRLDSEDASGEKIAMAHLASGGSQRSVFRSPATLRSVRL